MRSAARSVAAEPVNTQPEASLDTDSGWGRASTWSIPCLSSLRTLLRWSGPLLMAPLLLLPLGLLPAPALAAPANDAEMGLYTKMAAVNTCISRAAGVEFDKAVSIAGETIVYVLQNQHGGVIQQIGPKALSIEELRKGAVNSAVLGAVEICPKDVPADVTQKVQALLKQQKGSAAGGGAGPAPAPAQPK